MKLGVLGDTHGQLNGAVKALTMMDNITALIHTGDFAHDVDKLKKYIDIPLYGVKGNCDGVSKYPEELIENIGGYTIFITHGHKYGVKYGLNKLIYRGMEVKADIVIFGHTHNPQWFFEDGILFFNPGSISIPRGTDKPTFGLIHLNCDIIVPEILKI